jgi:hypothetical protein
MFPQVASLAHHKLAGAAQSLFVLDKCLSSLGCPLKVLRQQRNFSAGAITPMIFGVGIFLILLVNDSEYSKSTGSKHIFYLLAVFISFPLVHCAPPTQCCAASLRESDPRLKGFVPG